MCTPELPLAGGNSNESVVLVGDTVRRNQSKVSATVHRLLKYLEERNFTGAPRFLGVDEKGREILTYMKGECGIFSEHWNEDSYLDSAARLLREYHDIVVDFDIKENDCWGHVYPDASRHEVICHNDFAPYNLVSNHRHFTSVIDFDVAGPGPRLRDIAYTAYWLTPVSQRADDMKHFALKDVADGSRRLKRFCHITGVQANEELLNMISEVLVYMADEQALVNSIGQSAANRLKADGHLEHWAGEAEAFDQYRHSLSENLP